MAEPVSILLRKLQFETVFEDYYERIYKYTYTLLLNKEDAEDVTGNTFLFAYANYDRYDAERASIGTWLTRIAHNCAVNLLQSAARRKRADMPEDWEMAGGGDFTEQVETSDVLLRLYEKLSLEEREFLNLRYTMELKDKEIAELLHLKEKTVNKRYQRLLARCRKILEESCHD